MTEFNRQLTLLDLPPYTPIPLRPYHYVPALLNWPGEREALRTAAKTTWDGMTPLIQVAPKGMAKRTEVALSTVKGWATQLDIALGSHPFYLDVLGISSDMPTRPASARSILAHLYESARRRDLLFVPVCSSRDAIAVHAVREAAGVDRRGVAIRCRIGSSAFNLTPLAAEHGLSDLLTALGVDPTEADLLLDYGYIGPDEDLTANDVMETLDEVAQVGAWRNTVLIATSVPSSFADEVPEGFVGGIARREWELWESLRALTDRRLSVGDYGVQHPRVPGTRSGGRMRANVRYPTEEGLLVGRGVGAFQDLSPQERSDQYRKICHDLVLNRLFVGRGCCPGDRTIQDCADGVLPPGSQSMWRFAGTAHDLRLAASDVQKWSRWHSTAAAAAASVESHRQPSGAVREVQSHPSG